MPAAEAAPRANVARWVRLPAPQALVVLGAAVAGARLGFRPISDNSTLLHLRTGLELIRTGHVPHSDPYSFTAPGHRWVVQSWLASLLYGAAYRVGGHVLVALQAAVMAATAGVVALAARSTTAWRSGVAATIAVAASAPGWSPRPLMFELLCLALVILIVERGANPLWLVPVVWLWVNTHGSYPLGLAWLAARAAGEAIDARGWPRRTLVPLGAFVVGLAVSLVNPLTWRLLTFPFVALHKRGVFQGIVEWRSPNFQTANSLVALVFIAAGLMVLFRARLPWADALPVIGFLALGLVAERNLAPFGVVLAPALAHALSTPAPVRDTTAPGSIAPVTTGTRLEDRAREAAVRVGGTVVWRAAVAAIAAVVVIVLAVRSAGQPVLNLSSYPVAAANFLQSSGRFGPQHRIAEVDVVGCYLIWRGGPATKVFIDDRYDMYPPSVVADAGALGTAQGGQQRVLDTYHVDTVLWAANASLTGALPAEGGWRKMFDDGRWTVLERASSPS